MISASRFLPLRPSADKHQESKGQSVSNPFYLYILPKRVGNFMYVFLCVPGYKELYDLGLWLSSFEVTQNRTVQWEMSCAC